MAARISAFGRHPWRSLAALAALLVAAGATLGSGAAFTTQTVNPDNVFTSGILDVNSDKAGAILTVEDLVPGDTAAGTVTISNAGTVDGENWTLTQAPAGETPGSDPDGVAGSGLLSDRLNLRVVNQTTGATVYDGVIGDLGSAPLAAIPEGGSHTFAFEVTFPAGGADDDAFQGGALTESYTWSATAGS